jgi:hypothetical protein
MARGRLAAWATAGLVPAPGAARRSSSVAVGSLLRADEPEVEPHQL